MGALLRFRIADLPPLSKAAVQSICDMADIRTSVEQYTKWKEFYLSAHLSGIPPKYIIGLTGYSTNRSGSANALIWFKIIKHYGLLTPEITNELMPYILAGVNDG